MGNLQVVIQDSLGGNFKELLKTSVATCYKFTGTLVKSPAQGQAIEMLCNDPAIHSSTVLGHNLNPKSYPLAKKFHNPETLRQTLHLRPRSNLFGASMRIRNSISFAIHLFFQGMGFFYIHTPLITCSDCEGAGEMFHVTKMFPKDLKPEGLTLHKKKKILDFTKDFFARQTFLTVSGQLNV